MRCLALYDFESKLSRIVLYEERRILSTGSQRLIGIKLDDEPEPLARRCVCERERERERERLVLAVAEQLRVRAQIECK